MRRRSSERTEKVPCEGARSPSQSGDAGMRGAGEGSMPGPRDVARHHPMASSDRRHETPFEVRGIRGRSYVDDEAASRTLSKHDRCGFILLFCFVRVSQPDSEDGRCKLLQAMRRTRCAQVRMLYGDGSRIPRACWHSTRLAMEKIRSSSSFTAGLSTGRSGPASRLGSRRRAREYWPLTFLDSATAPRSNSAGRRARRTQTRWRSSSGRSKQGGLRSRDTVSADMSPWPSSNVSETKSRAWA